MVLPVMLSVAQAYFWLFWVFCVNMETFIPLIFIIIFISSLGWDITLHRSCQSVITVFSTGVKLQFVVSDVRCCYRWCWEWQVVHL